MVGHRDATTSSGGFSLDEVARLYRRARPGASARCPTCKGAMRSVHSEVTEQHVHFLSCTRCGRTVVFEQASQVAESGEPSAGWRR